MTDPKKIIVTIKKMANIETDVPSSFRQDLCSMLKNIELLDDIKRSLVTRKKVLSTPFQIQYPVIYKDREEDVELTPIIIDEFLPIMTKYFNLLQKKFIEHVKNNGFEDINEFITYLIEFKNLDFTINWRFACKTLNVSFQSILDEFNNTTQKIVTTILEVIESETETLKNKIINYTDFE